MRIVVASNRQASLEHFTRALAMETGAAVHRVQDSQQVPDLVRDASPTLVVVDGAGTDIPPKDLIMAILQVNAMVHTAVLSPLSDEDFHEEYEGLGVLAHAPLEPNGADARRLARILEKIMP